MHCNTTTRSYLEWNPTFRNENCLIGYCHSEDRSAVDKLLHDALFSLDIDLYSSSASKYYRLRWVSFQHTSMHTIVSTLYLLIYRLGSSPFGSGRTEVKWVFLERVAKVVDAIIAFLKLSKLVISQLFFIVIGIQAITILLQCG